MAGRDCDQQAAGFASPDFFERARQDAEVRGGGKVRLRGERGKDEPVKAIEALARIVAHELALMAAEFIRIAGA